MAFTQQIIVRVKSREFEWVGPAFFLCWEGESVCTPHKGGPWDLQIRAEECKQVGRDLGVGAGRRKAVTRPLALHQGDYPTGEKKEEKRGKERKKEGGPERIREWKQHSCSSRLFQSVKRHFLIKAILAFYLELWAIFTKSSSQVVFLSLFCVIKLHACRPHVQYWQETDVPLNYGVCFKNFLPIRIALTLTKHMKLEKKISQTIYI